MRGDLATAHPDQVADQDNLDGIDSRLHDLEMFADLFNGEADPSSFSEQFAIIERAAKSVDLLLWTYGHMMTYTADLARVRTFLDELVQHAEAGTVEMSEERLASLRLHAGRASEAFDATASAYCYNPFA